MGCVSLCCDKLRTFQSFLTHVFCAKALGLVGNSNALTPQTHVNDSPNGCKWAVNCDDLSRKYRFSSLFIPLMHPVSIVNFSISPLDTCRFIGTFLGQKASAKRAKGTSKQFGHACFLLSSPFGRRYAKPPFKGV